MLLPCWWYDFTRWLLERIDSFPKNQRFVFGTRLADHALDVLETLVKASYLGPGPCPSWSVRLGRRTP